MDKMTLAEIEERVKNNKTGVLNLDKIHEEFGEEPLSLKSAQDDSFNQAFRLTKYKNRAPDGMPKRPDKEPEAPPKATVAKAAVSLPQIENTLDTVQPNAVEPGVDDAAFESLKITYESDFDEQHKNKARLKKAARGNTPKRKKILALAPLVILVLVIVGFIVFRLHGNAQSRKKAELEASQQVKLQTIPTVGAGERAECRAEGSKEKGRIILRTGKKATGGIMCNIKGGFGKSDQPVISAVDKDGASLKPFLVVDALNQLSFSIAGIPKEDSVYTFNYYNR